MERVGRGGGGCKCQLSVKIVSIQCHLLNKFLAICNFVS